MTEATWLEDLRQVVDPARVRTDDGTLAQHSYDAWPLAVKWRQQHKQPYPPQAVVYPEDSGEVSRLLRWATKHGIPLTPWGAGSSVTGAPLPVKGGVVLDLSRMNHVLAIDEASLLVRVQAGRLGHELEADLNDRGYTLGHSPQSLPRSTAGGWVATRATGQFSSRWGSIEDLVLALTVVLPAGDVIEVGHVPRAALGPDLKHLFIGAEGTLGVVTEVTLKIAPQPPYRVLETLRFDEVASGLAAMRHVMRAGLRPFLLRFYDEAESRYVMRDQAFAGCVLLLGFEGQAAVAQAEHHTALDLARQLGGEPLGPQTAEAWMERRFDFSLIERRLAEPGGLAETIEVADTWQNVEATYHALRAALAPLAADVLGHFSHAYPQGTSLYMILLGREVDDRAAEAQLTAIWETAMRTSLERGAVLGHHHGVGLVRQPFLRAGLGSAASVLDRVKAALDPAGIMNPGKLGSD